MVTEVVTVVGLCALFVPPAVIAPPGVGVVPGVVTEGDAVESAERLPAASTAFTVYV
jgi:hypothetical protein